MLRLLDYGSAIAALKLDQVRTLAVLAEVDLSGEELPGFARGVERVRAFAAQLRELDVEDVTPWTPPS